VSTSKATSQSRKGPSRRKAEAVDKNFIALTDKVFAVLEVFSQNPRGPVSLEQITQSVSLAKTTVHRLLYSMKKLGYVDQRSNGDYLLSRKFYSLSAATLPYQHLTSLASTALRKLLARFGESVHVGILEKGLVVFVGVAESQHAYRCAAEIGDRNYAHSTAMGKCLLAHRTPEELDAIIAMRGLPRITPGTIVDKERLVLELEKVRNQGYAVNAGENTEGVTCVAAPIFGSAGDVVAALSVSGPTFRMHPTLDALRRGVQHETAKLSLLLGYRGELPDDELVVD